MKLKYLLLIVGALLLAGLVYAESQKVFQLTLEYNKGNITKESLYVKNGYFTPLSEQEGDYRVDIISFENNALYSQRFDFSLEIFGAPKREWFDEKGRQIYIPNETESGYKVLDETLIELIIPYFENAKLINIYDKDNNLKLSIDVSHFTRPKTIKGITFKKELYLFLIVLLIIIFIFYYNLKKLKKRKKKIK